MEEYVDIVDQNDPVLYKTSKEETHEKELLHRTVISEVINNKSRKFQYPQMIFKLGTLGISL